MRISQKTSIKSTPAAPIFNSFIFVDRSFLEKNRPHILDGSMVDSLCWFQICHIVGFKDILDGLIEQFRWHWIFLSTSLFHVYFNRRISVVNVSILKYYVLVYSDVSVWLAFLSNIFVVSRWSLVLMYMELHC